MNACGQYTFGDSTYTSSGVYTHTFDVDSTSCDSTVILTLNLDTTVGVATSYSSGIGAHKMPTSGMEC